MLHSLKLPGNKRCTATSTVETPPFLVTNPDQSTVLRIRSIMHVTLDTAQLTVQRVLVMFDIN